ncbi:hypothetical protein QVD17_09128 [Tagetes erecta]|uniref:Retrotransposon Copia-like N-terminal domain-containing protein n=1 Tax=Tagetes erecta TaxID=13708 RepID=A0AAD8L103_TARER|nr:hypothetical protein QVD17_09128 [Tagetes erecta]
MTEMNTTPTPDLTLPATLNSDSETCGDGDDNGKGDICFKGDRSSSSSSSSLLLKRRSGVFESSYHSLNHYLSSLPILAFFFFLFLFVHRSSNMAPPTPTSSSSDSTNSTQQPTPTLTNLANLVSIKLDHDNYLAWKYQIVTILKTMGLLAYISKDSKSPAKESPDLVNWEKADGFVTACINATLVGP